MEIVMFSRKKLYFVYLFVLLLIPFVYNNVYSDSIPEFKIMTEEWEPYNFKKDGIARGLSVDMLVLMLDRVGSTQSRDDIEILPWARGYDYAQNQANTILFSTTRIVEREEMFKWVGPIFESIFYVFALKSRNIKINSHKELSSYKFGTLRDDVVENILIEKSDLTLNDFYRSNNNLHNTKMLAAGRIDFVASSFETLNVTCRKAGINPGIFESVIILEKKSIYYAFHKDTADSVILTFQKAFDELKSEGVRDEILKRYGK